MDYLLDQLQPLTPGGYVRDGPLAAEPTAWAAVALAMSGRSDGASRAADWLAAQQSRDGSIPVTSNADGPHWTTSLAILAWTQIDASRARFASHIDRAVEWLLATKGKPSPQSPHIGHNATLVGWSWAAATHSWLEPTAFATMALTATGYRNHARTREAVEILVDRLLPSGGCNYGNTMVLGQTLLPHLQPSGIVLWALATHGVDDPRIEASLEYLQREVLKPTGTASLAYALIALTAWDKRPNNADELIARVALRSATTTSCYRLALLALASSGYAPSISAKDEQTLARPIVW